jgi:hypothetical protein
VTLLSPVPKAGLFKAVIGATDLITIREPIVCKTAPNYVLDAFVDYSDNVCKPTYHGTAPD